MTGEALNDYQCAFNDEKHFLIEPIELNCGHYVCKKCGKSKTNGILTCFICDKKTRLDFQNLNENNEMKYNIRANIQFLFAALERQYAKSFSDLNNCITKILENTEFEIETAKKHVEHRINVMKSQLDVLGSELKDELIDYETKVKKELSKIDLQETGKELDDLKTFIRNHEPPTDHKFFDFQKKMLNINTLLRDLSNFSQEIMFESSKLIFKKDQIGKIKTNTNCIQRINNINVANRIREGRYKLIYLNVEPFDLCVLPNGNILCADFREHNISVYDKHLKLIKKVDKIDKFIFGPTSLTTNKLDKLYVCDYSNDRIFITDFELAHVIKTIDSDEYKTHQFCDPSSICYFNDFLYICDTYNKKIQKLTSSLKFKISYKFDYSPKQIKITNYVACVRPLDQCSIFFYRTDTFELKHRYDGHNGSISEINSFFYEYYEKNKKLYSYDGSGQLIDEILTKGFNNRINIEDVVQLVYLNSEILISSKDSKKLISIQNIKSSTIS